MRRSRDKILDLSKLRGKSEQLRKEKRSIVTTNGCFDLLHAGHFTYLEKARSFGDFLLVGVNSDRSVKSLKGPHRPICSEQDRLLAIASLESVDGVFIFDDLTPESWLREVKPNIHVKGSDYRGQKIPEQCVSEWGGRLEFVSLVEGSSTSAIIERIRAMK